MSIWLKVLAIVGLVVLTVGYPIAAAFLGW